jgi:hypothetical protein
MQDIVKKLGATWGDDQMAQGAVRKSLSGFFLSRPPASWSQTILPFSRPPPTRGATMQSVFSALLAYVVSRFLSHQSLRLENMLLRHQLAVSQQTIKRP